MYGDDEVTEFLDVNGKFQFLEESNDEKDLTSELRKIDNKPHRHHQLHLQGHLEDTVLPQQGNSFFW